MAAAPQPASSSTHGLTPSGSSEPSKKSLLDKTILKVAISTLSLVGSCYLYYMSMLNPYAALGILLANGLVWLKGSSTESRDGSSSEAPNPAAAPRDQILADDDDEALSDHSDSDFSRSASASATSSGANDPSKLTFGSATEESHEEDAASIRPLGTHSDQTSSSQPNSGDKAAHGINRVNSEPTLLADTRTNATERVPVGNIAAGLSDLSDDEDDFSDQGLTSSTAGNGYGTHGRNQTRLRLMNPVDIHRLQASVKAAGTQEPSSPSGDNLTSVAADSPQPATSLLDSDDTEELEALMNTENDSTPRTNETHSRHGSNASSGSATSGRGIRLTPTALSHMSSTPSNREPLPATAESPVWLNQRPDTGVYGGAETASAPASQQANTPRSADSDNKETDPTGNSRRNKTKTRVRQRSKNKTTPGSNNS